MESFISKSVLLLLGMQMCFSTIVAGKTCGDIVCYENSLAEPAYCCGTLNDQCCHYKTPNFIYYKWYFWVGIAALHFVVIACIIIGYRRRIRTNSFRPLQEIGGPSILRPNMTSPPYPASAQPTVTTLTARPYVKPDPQKAQQTVEAIIMYN